MAIGERRGDTFVLIRVNDHTFFGIAGTGDRVTWACRYGAGPRAFVTGGARTTGACRARCLRLAEVANTFGTNKAVVAEFRIRVAVIVGFASAILDDASVAAAI